MADDTCLTATSLDSNLQKNLFSKNLYILLLAVMINTSYNKLDTYLINLAREDKLGVMNPESELIIYTDGEADFILYQPNKNRCNQQFKKQKQKQWLRK